MVEDMINSIIIDSNSIRMLPTYSYATNTCITTPEYQDRLQTHISTYENAMNFNEQDTTVSINAEVLMQLVSRIKELEESNAKNWAELLKENA